VDSYLRIRDLGLERDLNGVEQGVFVIARTGTSELVGMAGSAVGGSSAVVGVVCGPGAPVCASTTAVVGSVVSGVAGDALGTYIFDRVVDVAMPTYLDLRPWGD
jgi:hypothetical protein